MEERRTDLDWLRIWAFALLILFHVGMFYVPWEWEVKSPRLLPWLQIAMEASAPWRLLLLFLISGAATSFMCRRLSPNDLLASRSAHLLPPLIFTLLVVAPPQLYFKVVEQFDYAGGFWQFLPRYFGLGSRFCRDGHCLIMPNWEHLWFVVYLWIYTTLLVAVLLAFPRLKALGFRLLGGWRLLVLPALGFGLLHVALGRSFPITHGLVDDWYDHVMLFSGFVFGFLLLSSPQIMQDFASLRWFALPVALASYGLRTAYVWHFQGGQPIPVELKAVMAIVYGFDQWAWIAAAMGFAYRHLSSRDGPARRYLTEAIFPYYIVHQTAIVVLGHELARLGLPLAVEALLLIAGCTASCALTFEVVRRVAWLRPMFGLKPIAMRNNSSAVGISTDIRH